MLAGLHHCVNHFRPLRITFEIVEYPVSEVFFKRDTGWLTAKILREGRRNQVRQVSVSNMTNQECKYHPCPSRQFRDTIENCDRALCCALHNFRVRLTPWQPLI